MVNKNSPLPIYYQIEEEIKRQIDSGELSPGEMLPSEREFAEKYAISRMTVRQAITNLVNEGLLVRQKGRGTFVQRKKIEQELKGLTSFSEQMRSRGMEPSTKLIEFNVVQASERVARALQVNIGSEVYELKRLRLADQMPMALETAYLVQENFPYLNKEVAKGSLYEYVENTIGVSIDYATQTVDASIANKFEADALEISEGDPVLVIHRLAYLSNEKPMEFVKTIYRADRYTFSVDVKR
ncbi:phosphonate metabolism transcriptional regulator PhnF [Pseudalkalibacillus caeni]|uniref:Phosphonate metabolism transcriptional regulator PhnF n=1 Tax=Exobacillus caeni TaxID=2574798 RepID=A0A5R9F5G8_9BACL|nr:phosphonate metabolism transcriptional regulator PhnF [Pseudalkalibacillus caeni]TLS38767.1 phosphonate metabolism transcriptional regulator PhnF [Pseudalkalibacillus caeni]